MKKNSRPNPDNREDNARRIQNNISHTIQNIEAADEMIAETSDKKMKMTLTDKNERRRQALHGMRSEMKDESHK